MITNNYYPVSFMNFVTMKSVGEYIVMYAVLDDRVHFEMVVENAVYVSQKFLADIDNEIEAKAANYGGDKLQVFLKMTLSNQTFYRYYPTEEQIKEIKAIKLFNKVVVKEVTNGKFDKNNVKIVESDNLIKAMNGNELIMEAKKVQ